MRNTPHRVTVWEKVRGEPDEDGNVTYTDQPPKDGSKPMDLPELVGALIGQNERVGAFPFDGYWRDLGSPREYELANEDLESRKVVLSRP